jgi:gamma-glutamyltranspeptidase / glutathione hydrolase
MSSFPSHRSVVMATHGIVATGQPLAAQAGLDILKAGGNAADAAVATAAMLNVVEPMNTGVGGDMFAIVYDGKTGKVSALNGSGRSPYAATIDKIRQSGYKKMPMRGFLCATVPGAVAGWNDLLKAHGTMRLARVLEPAISYAKEGYPVSEIIASYWEAVAPKLSDNPAAAATFLINGRSPRKGDIMRLPDLARSLETIAQGGADAFYRGAIAQAIVDHSRQNGGLFDVADFADHASTWTAPISSTYRGIKIYECPPNGQGLVALLALNMLQNDDLAALGHNSADYLHLLIEVLKLAFADGYTHIADPDLSPAPLDSLLSAEHAQQQRARVDMYQAADGPVYDYGSDTVYLTVVDKDHNAVSFINSLFNHFGCGIVIPGTGICLQNRGGLFTLNPNHANALAPHKRPYHTIIPAIATKDGKLFLSFGLMGDFMQPQGHLQVVADIVDFGMDPQQALDAPRLRFNDGRRVAIEHGLPEKVYADLRTRGHDLEVTSNGRPFGGGQIIMVHPETGVLMGGSDPRKDGCAVGW